MPTKITINVTEEKIKEAMYCGLSGYFQRKGGYSTNCPIALTLFDIFPNATIEANVIIFYNRRNRAIGKCKLPQVAQAFILEFDDKTPEERAKMKPISFEISVPNSVINLISIKEIKDKLKTDTFELINN